MKPWDGGTRAAREPAEGLGETARQMLELAGWSPRRRVQVDDRDPFHQGLLPHAVKSVLERYGSLRVPIHPSDWFHFDHRIAAASQFATNVASYELEIDGFLYPIGQAHRDHATLFMDEDGRVVATFDDYMTLLGEHIEDAINALCEQRETPRIDLFPRTGHSQDIIRAIEDALAAREAWRVRRIGLELMNGNPEIRKRAIAALAMFGDVRSIAPLADLILVEDVPALAISAIHAIRDIGTTEALRAFEHLLQDHRPYVRTAALEALEAVGDLSSIPALEDAILDDEPCERLNAEGQVQTDPNTTLASAARRAISTIRQRHANP